MDEIVTGNVQTHARNPARTTTSTGNDHGQILILTALSMVALLGIAALAIDASFMYDKRNKLHAAADAAAKSAAIEVHRNSTVSQTELEAFADQQIVAHGFLSTRGGGTATVVVNRPPASGPFAGNTNYVEVIASEPTATFFGVVLGLTSMTPGARAVAGTSPNPNCIYTLENSATSFTIGTSTLTMPSCSIADGGNLNTTTGSVSINAQSIGITGVCTGNSCPQPNQYEGAPAPADPLAGLAAPADPGTCAPGTLPLLCDVVVSGGAPKTLSPGKYRMIDARDTNVNLTFSPGIYYITGPLLVGNNSTVTGSGVLLYFAGVAPVALACTILSTAGCIDVQNNANWSLSAATSGAYNGILFFQATTNHMNATFDGNNPTYNLSGAMYFPNANVSFRNGMNTTNDCTLLVANTFWIDNGSGTFSNTCSAYGGSPILTVSIAE